MGFPTNHRWCAYLTPNSPNGWLKERLFRSYRLTACNPTHGIAVEILSVRLSVCLSVRPSDACIVTKLSDGLRIFGTTRYDNHSSFLTSTTVGGRCSLLSEICAQSNRPPSKNTLDFRS